MAETNSKSNSESPLKPLVTFLKMLGVFLDVGTYMMRLLVNTLVYNTPHGKQELSGRPDSAS